MNKFHIVFKTTNKELEFDKTQEIVTTGKTFKADNIITAITSYLSEGYILADIVIVYSVGSDGNIKY